MRMTSAKGRSKIDHKLEPIRVIILGAGGRDFHNFNTCYRNRPSCQVVAFTATQIPYIENRLYPPELAGQGYPKGIPIYPEDDLPRLIKEYRVEQAVFAYSDVSHEELMDKASLVLSLGSQFSPPRSARDDDREPPSGRFDLWCEDGCWKIRNHP